MTPLVVSANALAVLSQLLAPARLKVVPPTAEVPFLLSKPFTASWSAAFSVTEKSGGTAGGNIIGGQGIGIAAWPVSVNLVTSMVSPVVMPAAVTLNTPLLAS